jgi:L-fuculose-phosphate aldolase
MHISPGVPNPSALKFRVQEMLDQEFERIGKRLFLEGLVGANFGNMSVRAKAGLYITRSGAYLDAREMPAFVPEDGEAPPEASSEYRVHRAVYRETPYLAIVHAHPVHAVAASLDADLLRPVDSEGGMLCPEIPVVGGEPGTDEIARNVAEALRGGTSLSSAGTERLPPERHLTRRISTPLLPSTPAGSSSYRGGLGGFCNCSIWWMVSR